YNPLDPVLNCPAAPNVPTTPCLPASPLPCPVLPDGTLPVMLSGGDYYCNQTDLATKIPPETVQFPLSFRVAPGTGPVSLYIIPTDNPPTKVTVSVANTGCYPQGLYPCPIGINNVDLEKGGSGDPTKLRVYLAGGGLDAGDGSHGGDFTGIMYAPNADE